MKKKNIVKGLNGWLYQEICVINYLKRQKLEAKDNFETKIFIDGFIIGKLLCNLVDGWLGMSISPDL